jgi:hypothetical protein
MGGKDTATADPVGPPPDGTAFCVLHAAAAAAAISESAGQQQDYDDDEDDREHGHLPRLKWVGSLPGKAPAGRGP